MIARGFLVASHSRYRVHSISIAYAIASSILVNLRGNKFMVLGVRDWGLVRGGKLPPHRVLTGRV